MTTQKNPDPDFHIGIALLAILFLSIICIIYFNKAHAQAASWTQSTLFSDTVINNTSIEGQGAISTSSGASIQLDITNCVGCSVSTELRVSVDGQTYQVISDFSKIFTNNSVVVFNLYGQFFKYFWFKCTETNSQNATVRAIYGTKNQI